LEDVNNSQGGAMSHPGMLAEQTNLDDIGNGRTAFRKRRLLRRSEAFPLPYPVSAFLSDHHPPNRVMKSALRRIQVNEVRYLWRVRGSLEDQVAGEPRSLTLVVVYREGCPRGGLHVSFTTWSDAMTGNPLLCGVPVSANAPAINLNQPSCIRRVIEHAVSKGWTGAKPLRLADGMEIFGIL
jgi:hypothetical protein